MLHVNLLVLDFPPNNDLGSKVADVLASCRRPGLRMRYEAISQDELDNGAGERVAALASHTNDDIVFLVISTPLLNQCRRLITWLSDKSAEQIVVAVDTEDPNQVFAALEMGVSDFVTPPIKACDVLPRVWRLIDFINQKRFLTQKLRTRLGLQQFVGESRAFRYIIERISLIAQSSANVLITGETGTGKEMCAHAIHDLCPRQQGPFVPVNCGAIPEELIENELFGHERGAYTGAERARDGLIQEADGGTLFLDEIDALPPAAQVKLLRVLQEREYRSLGSTRIRKVDVRFIAATNVDVEKAVESGRLRQDIYYRLNVIPLRLPPLRKRDGDAPLLADYFLKKYAAEFGKPNLSLSPEAVDLLRSYDWPGNVRELENVIERSVALSAGKIILAADLDLPGVNRKRHAGSFRAAKERFIEEFESDYIKDLLLAYEGNVTKAARAAEKNRRAFWELMRKHNIDAGHFKPRQIGHSSTARTNLS